MGDSKSQAKHSELSDLHSVKIGIGDVIQLQDFSSAKHRYYVKLIGYLNKKSVLVSHPTQDEKLLFVKKGESFLVRGFSGTKTYDFTADVTNVCLTPYPYLHLSFPAHIHTVNMRCAMRIKIRMVCSIKLKKAEEAIAATVDDLSISGARILSKVEFGHVGEHVELSFRLPVDGVEQLIVLPTIIRNISADKEDSSGERLIPIGLEFQHSEGDEHNTLQYFVYKNLAEH
jgi:c-di-GMP-binding flagellar brake protein YcgR